MTLQIWFWLFYALGLLGNFWFGYSSRPVGQSYGVRFWGGDLLIFILIGILGYAQFGSAVK